MPVLACVIVLPAACGSQPPLVATVCQLTTYAQRTVQVDAEISVDNSGHAVLGDARCAATMIELRLSAAASRAGAAEQLKLAAQAAVGSGKPSVRMKLIGVFTNEATGTYFVAESVTSLPPPK
jgi:hypothetical protein